MISIDTNILFYAYNSDSPPHQSAYKWLESIQGREDVAISEFILVEFYCLLRNPSVLKRPLPAKDAVNVIQAYRNHPKWRIVGFPQESRGIHTQLWTYAGDPDFAFRKIYDSRTALTLLHHGVTEFATRNIKDFRNFDFQKVWDPTTTP